MPMTGLAGVLLALSPERAKTVRAPFEIVK
jgi:hypothetical protein